MNVILYSDKKWPDPQTQLSPSKVQVLAKRSRSYLVTSTGPVVIAEEARCPGSNWPWAPQATQVAGTRSCRLWPRERGRCPYRQGWGRGSPSPQSLGRASRWSWWGLWSPTGHSPPTSFPIQKPGELEGPRKKAGICLLPHSLPAWWPPLHWLLADCWTTNGHSLTVGCLGEGPTAAATNGWAGPLTVTHWQLLTWGRGTLWHQPMAEQPVVVSK